MRWDRAARWSTSKRARGAARHPRGRRTMLEKIVNTLAFPRPPRSGPRTHALRRDPNLLWLTLASTGGKVPALYRQRKASASGSRILVIYSHGNAEDLAELGPLIALMSERLEADVLAYDYPGYSIADGSPTETGVYEAAAAAYAWALCPASSGGGGAAPDEVVPFGRSLGSAPACFLASIAPVGGLLLQSPLLSGANAMLGSGVATVGSCLDVFKNGLYIRSSSCRVAICHGTEDEVVPCWNGRKLHALCAERAFEPLWCNGRGHNDMDEEAVLAWARSFLDSLRDS